MKDLEERFTHPSYGQLQISRASGTADFYGSELTQDHFITLTIHPSEVHRTLTREWYYARRLPLIQVRMSSNQFAEAITSLNVGSGVPCTVEMLDGKKVERYTPLESRKEFVHRAFQDRMKEFGDTIRERQSLAKELVKKKTLSKEDIHNLTHHLEWLTGEVERNIPFFAKCFQETADEIVAEAKSEVENAIMHKINTLGLGELQKQNLLLTESKSEQKP